MPAIVVSFLGIQRWKQPPFPSCSSPRERELHAHKIRIAARPWTKTEARGEPQHGAIAPANQPVQHGQLRAAGTIEQPLHELAPEARALHRVRYHERDFAACTFRERDERVALECGEARVARIRAPCR